MIPSENGLLVVTVLLNVRGRDVGSFLEEARGAVAKSVQLPQGSYIEWSGQYENEVRAKRRLQSVLPVAFLVIYLLLYVTYHSFVEVAHVLLAVPFALSGGMFLLYALGHRPACRPPDAHSAGPHGGSQSRRAPPAGDVI